MISKAKSLFFLITGCLLVVLCIAQFIFFGATLRTDVRTLIVQQQQSVFLSSTILIGVLAAIIYVGLYMVMRKLSVARWRRGGIYVFFAIKIITVALPMLMFYNVQSNMDIVLKIRYLLTTFAYLYVHCTFIMGGSAPIKRYSSFIGYFGIAIQVVGFAIELIYNKLGISWLRLDVAPLFTISYIASLLVFIEAYRISSQTAATDTPANGSDISEEFRP